VGRKGPSKITEQKKGDSKTKGKGKNIEVTFLKSTWLHEKSFAKELLGAKKEKRGTGKGPLLLIFKRGKGPLEGEGLGGRKRRVPREGLSLPPRRRPKKTRNREEKTRERKKQPEGDKKRTETRGERSPPPQKKKRAKNNRPPKKNRTTLP